MIPDMAPEQAKKRRAEAKVWQASSPLSFCLSVSPHRGFRLRRPALVSICTNKGAAKQPGSLQRLVQ